MKSIEKIFVELLVCAFCLQPPFAIAGIGDFFEEIKKAAGIRGDLSNNDVVEGLKQALEIGTSNAVKSVSTGNGYYENPKIKIPLPTSIQKVKRLLLLAGYGPQVDAFELSMNRAAEQAAPKAKALFWDSIKKMSFSDARKILDGSDNAATLYFEDKTRGRLFDQFEPIVRSSMSKVGVTRAYQNLDAQVRQIPFAAGSINFDLDQYVTNQALNGLFLTLAEEERKIRQDLAARVTDLLKQVFGAK